MVQAVTKLNPVGRSPATSAVRVDPRSPQGGRYSQPPTINGKVNPNHIPPPIRTTKGHE